MLCHDDRENVYISGNRITSGNFVLNYPITFNQDGSYSTRIFARRGIYSNILGESGSSSSWIAADTIDAYPDSIIKKDIHFICVFGIKEKPLPSNPDLYIVNYPNPFNPSTNFYIRTPNYLKSKVGRIDIYNSVGQKIFVVPVSNTSSYRWNGVDMSGKTVASGVYYYRLVFDNAIYKTGSMILLK